MHLTLMVSLQVDTWHLLCSEMLRALSNGFLEHAAVPHRHKEQLCEVSSDIEVPLKQLYVEADV
jgi:hypothetical protein